MNAGTSSQMECMGFQTKHHQCLLDLLFTTSGMLKNLCRGNTFRPAVATSTRTRTRCQASAAVARSYSYVRVAGTSRTLAALAAGRDERQLRSESAGESGRVTTCRRGSRRRQSCSSGLQRGGEASARHCATAALGTVILIEDLRA